MPRISQLDPLTGLSKLDMFEVTQRANNKSCSITAQEMGNYFKTLNNGSFKGSTNKGLDSFTVADVGVWHWYGSDQVVPLTEGILEIISYAGSDDDDSDGKFLQKLAFGNKVYQRGYNGGTNWSNWAELGNKNGCRIEFGTTTDAHITFTEPFHSAPSVVVTPFNGPSSRYIYLANVYNITVSGFDIFKVKSNLEASVENTTETTTESGGTTTKTIVTDITRGAWVQDDDIEVRWIALSDYDA